MRYPPSLSTNYLYLDYTQPSKTTTKQQPTMDSSFHKFPELPTELRLKIWEAACSRTKTKFEHGGLQYVDIREGEAVVPAPQSSSQVSLGRINRSAYLIDAGLWKACKESRVVFDKHMQLHKGLSIRERTSEAIAEDTKYAGQSGIPIERYRVDWMDPKNRYNSLPAPIRSDEGDEQCPMLAYPSLDAFCFRVDNWLALQDGKLFFPEIKMSTCLINNAGRPYRLSNYIQEIALEFESSWVIDLPDYFFSLPYENSARGYLAYLLKNRLADGVRHGMNGVSIIDKNVKWFEGPASPVQWLYWDCDAEYIQVQWEQVAHRGNISDDEAVDAGGFFHKMDRFLHQTRDVWPPKGPYPSQFPGDAPLKWVIKLLVRRDNQVNRAITGCEAKCHEIGWCLCRDEVGDWQEGKGLDDP